MWTRAGLLTGRGAPSAAISDPLYWLTAACMSEMQTTEPSAIIVVNITVDITRKWNDNLRDVHDLRPCVGSSNGDYIRRNIDREIRDRIAFTRPQS